MKTDKSILLMNLLCGCLLFVALIMYISLSYSSFQKPDDYSFVFLDYRANLPITDYSHLTVIRPHKSLTLSKIKEQLGEPKETKDHLLHDNKHASDRPEVLTCYIYNQMIFVTSDFSSNPEAIVMVVVRK